MPPNGPPLPVAQIQLITDWINDGAKEQLGRVKQIASLRFLQIRSHPRTLIGMES